ncbi:MAG TPA: DUF5666 domain-containing protein [Anaerolineaceae bacterium]|jgi:hypothetical protein
MKAAPSAELLQDCLLRLQHGASLEDVLARHPEQAGELRPLLEAALAARSLRAEIHVPREAQLRSRAQFLQAAARPARPSLRVILRTGWVLASVVTVLALALVGTGFASAQSLPGDQLYPVKIAAEQARLQIVSDPAQRLQITGGYDRERVDEVEALLTRDQLHPVEVSFAGFLSQPAPNEAWMVGSIELILPDSLPNRADLKVGRYVDVQGVPEAGGKVLVETIRPRIEQLSGSIQQIDSHTLKVDQLTLDLSANTQISGAPVVGDQVEAQVARQEDGSLQAYVVDVAHAAGSPTLSATLTRTQTAWAGENGAAQTPTPGQTVAAPHSPDAGESDHPVSTPSPHNPGQGETEHPSQPTHTSGQGERGGSPVPSAGNHSGGD